MIDSDSDHDEKSGRSSGDERPKKRRRLACLACRTAKVKCDWPDGDSSCARCKRLGEPCEAAVARPRGRASRKHDGIAQLMPPGSLGMSQPPVCSNLPLMMALNGPADDQFLDCEQGITSVFSTRRPMSDVPVDLLREWVLTALHRRDCALLGRAMTISAAAGYTMEGVLGDVSTLATVLQRISSLLQVVSSEGNANSSTTTYSRLIKQRKALSCTLPSTITEMDDGKGLLFVKSCKDGAVQFDTNAPFESCVCSQDTLMTTFEANQRPATKRFLHPEDVPKICEVVGHLWGLIKDQEYSTFDGLERCVTLIIPNVRVWLNTHQAYLPCSGAARLVVRRAEGHCTHLAMLFTPKNSAAPSRFQTSSIASTPPTQLTPRSAERELDALAGPVIDDPSQPLSFDLSSGDIKAEADGDTTGVMGEGMSNSNMMPTPPLTGPVLDDAFDLDDLWVEITPEMFV
jgi:hypothetical protein